MRTKTPALQRVFCDGSYQQCPKCNGRGNIVKGKKLGEIIGIFGHGKCIIKVWLNLEESVGIALLPGRKSKGR